MHLYYAHIIAFNYAAYGAHIIAFNYAAYGLDIIKIGYFHVERSLNLLYWIPTFPLR